MKWLQAAVLIVAAAHFVNLLPTSLGFERFAFGDSGWSLTVDSLLDEGQTPTTDFAYFYGLLTLLIDRAAFALFGRTPETVVELYGICALAIAIGAARTMAALQLRLLPALYLVACAALLAIPRGFPSPAHALEAALLMSAIADHASGWPGRALMLVVVAVFVKPALGYVYGLILLALILSGWPGEASRWRRLLPAAGVGAVLLVALVEVFGWGPVLSTQLPFTAMKAYSETSVGFFFGVGQLFWLPEYPSPWYYFTGVPGVWLASSLVLLASALRFLPRYREPAASITLTCAVLHLVFVTELFGNQWSWIYYPYVLFVGTAVGLMAWPPRIRGLLSIGLIALAILGQQRWLWRGDANAWSDTQRMPETAGLFARPDEAAAWGELRELGKTSSVVVLSSMGCPHLLAPELDGPRWWCLMRPIATPAEMDRVHRRIAAAEWIVAPDWHDNDLMRWPEFAAELQPFDPTHPVRETPFYKLYHRRP
jgi:hypothetical protein